MKILIVGYNLSMGGIQRALINTLQVLAANSNNEIDLFLFSNKGELAEELPGNVTIIKSNYLLTLTATPFSEVIKSGTLFDKMIRILLTIFVRLVGSTLYFKILFSLQKKKKPYQVAISYFNDVPQGYFNRGSNQYVIENVVAEKKIAWIHTDPIKAQFNRERSLKSYRNFDKIVNVSKAGKEKFDVFIPEYKYKSAVVYNIFPYKTIQDRANDFVPKYRQDITNLVTVARIDNATKRIDRIIEVVHLLKLAGYEHFKWWLVGDGPDRDKNYALADKYGVMDLLEFTGEKVNPLPYMKYADVFVLASDYEGYPMVVGEALALGTPVITTAYASAREQLVDRVNGIIVETDTEALFDTLKAVLEDRNILIGLQEQSRKKRGNNGEAMSQLQDILR
ncbi:glycosyltransferase [Sporosarcina sp. YIM B06819]|uniref:glycosyltransferase n=1 Tax=Sporosarcina sp. YIM B06819 TaxID=3081769 RepID=UPI00298D34FB|nr:glycosyltransferase [Sporosarcina sp. YIM B06819]